jgi:hypothetical protein
VWKNGEPREMIMKIKSKKLRNKGSIILIPPHSEGLTLLQTLLIGSGSGNYISRQMSPSHFSFSPIALQQKKYITKYTHIT